MIRIFAFILFSGVYLAFNAGTARAIARRGPTDSIAIRKVIDSIYDHKEADLISGLKAIDPVYRRALSIGNRGLMASALNVKGTIYGDLGDYTSGLRCQYEALGIFKSINDEYNTAMLTNNIGKIYSEAGKTKEALSYLLKAEDLAKSGRLNKVLIFVYANLANAWIQSSQLKKALHYALLADSLNHPLNLKVVQARNANTIGAIYYFLNDMPHSLAFYQKSRELARDAKDSSGYFRAGINIGEVFEVTRQADPLPYYRKALDFFSLSRDYRTVNYVAGDISNYYKAKGDYASALEYYQQAVKAAEQNKSLQAANTMALLQIRYETSEKEKKIMLLNKENTIQKLSIAGRNKTIGIISGIFIFSIVLAVLLYGRARQKRRELAQQQLSRQREELTEAVIEAEEKERRRIAADLHDGIGQLFSAVRMNLGGLFDRVTLPREEDRFLAEKTMALVDESCREVRVISHQMMPNMLLRSGIASDVKNFIEKLDSETLKVKLEAKGFKNRLESSVETVLYRVIQETVNNVIKHANASELDIYLERDESGINAIIRDNGIGFDTGNIESFEGIGLKNIVARLKYLKGDVSYASAPGRGTTVSVRVPV